jgi:hypothetical protein
MKWPIEFDPAFMARQPTDRRLKRLKAVELDPNPLVDCGTFNEFHLAAFRAGIEHPDAKSARTGTPYSDLGIETEPVRAAPVAGNAGIHRLKLFGNVVRFPRSCLRRMEISWR